MKMNQIKKLIESDFLEVLTIKENEILRIKPPLTVKFEPNVIEEIGRTLVQKEEMGGILACRPTWVKAEKVLSVEQVIFIKNISKKPYNSYKPYMPDLERAISKVFLEDQLLPINFHSHPISGTKPGSQLFEYFFQMGTSPADQSLADRPVRIENYKIAFPEAVLIKDIMTLKGFFIGIYGGFIAPKDFDLEIIKTGIEKGGELGEYVVKWFQKQVADPKKKELIKIISLLIVFLMMILLLAYPRKTISFLAVLLMIGTIYIWRTLPILESTMGAELSYFGVAHINKTLGIKIPDFKITDYYLKEPKIIKLRKTNKK